VKNGKKLRCFKKRCRRKKTAKCVRYLAKEKRIFTRNNKHYYIAFQHLFEPIKVVLKVLAKNDAHIFIGDAKRNYGYEIVLGGWRNKKSVIRSKKGGRILAVRKGRVLDDKKWIKFLIIKVGRNLKIYREGKLFMQFNQAYKKCYMVWFMTGYGATGRWKARLLEGENDIPKHCSRWFDGCNVCKVRNRQIGVCSKKKCHRKKAAKCLRYYEKVPINIRSSKWHLIRGKKLVYITVSANGQHVWGINHHGHIYYRGGVGKNWRRIKGSLKQISVSALGERVWGVNRHNAVYYRNGFKGQWIRIGGSLKFVSVSGGGNHIWGIDPHSKLFYRNGVRGRWKRVSGRLQVISISGNGAHVWGVNNHGIIYYRNGYGGRWKRISGRLLSISVSANGRHIWGVDSHYTIYYRGGILGKWFIVPGKLLQVSAMDNGYCWGISRGNSVYVRLRRKGFVMVKDIPLNCTTWFDGCNVCEVSNGNKLGCTKRHCRRKRPVRCVSFKGRIPVWCTVWFDGCNVCQIKNRKKLFCTKKHCRRKKRAKCVRPTKKITPCKTTKNVPCVFPFTYKGKKYYKCTTKNYGKKLWCATTAVYRRGKWGRCKPGCKAISARIPELCSMWFDGCNLCQVKNRKKRICTRKHCDRYKRAKCVSYRKGSCKTTKNVPCVFPFTYKGKKYYKCTNKNYGKKLWCATVAVYKKGKWGRCKPGCKGTGIRIPKLCKVWFDGCNACRVKGGKKVVCTKRNCSRNGRARCARYRKVSCVTTKNIPCVFPFTYKGKKYHKCTTKNYGKKLWCATTAVYKKGKWG